MMKIREPIVEGIFYPSDRRKLRRLITSLLDTAETRESGAWGIIAPHAGFRYSGAIAANAFKAAQGRPIRTVVILAPIYRTENDEIIFPESEKFKMPDGLLPVNGEAIEELAGFSTQFRKDDIPHLEEHSIEVQLPFVSALFPKTDIVPVLIGRVKRKTVVMLARALSQVFEKRLASTLFIVSANLTSFMQGRDAKAEAEIILRLLGENNADDLLTAYETGRINSCGVPPMAALMHSAGRDCDVRVLSSGSSAEVNNNFQELVQYAAVGFFAKKA